MTEETAHAAVDLALQLYKQQKNDNSLGVVFFGGEPLLCHDVIKSTIKYCKEVEKKTDQLFHYKITTNGYLLEESFLTDPLTSEIFVALSHDGVQPAHDTHRINASGQGTFTELQPVMDILLRHKPYAPVMLVTTPETIEWYAESVKYLFSRGFRYLICSLNYSGAWTESTLKELEAQYHLLFRWYEYQTEQEEKFYFSPFDVKISSHIYPGSCRQERCELGQKQVSIAPTGLIFPCVQFVGNGEDSEWCIGDVKNGINETRRESLYRKNDTEKETCFKCAIRERCNHFCGCLNKQATGTIYDVSPVLCAHEQMTIRIADRLAEKLFRKKNPMFVQKYYNELFPLVSLTEDHKTKQGLKRS